MKKYINRFTITVAALSLSPLLIYVDSIYHAFVFIIAFVIMIELIIIKLNK